VNKNLSKPNFLFFPDDSFWEFSNKNNLFRNPLSISIFLIKMGVPEETIDKWHDECEKEMFDANMWEIREGLAAGATVVLLISFGVLLLFVLYPIFKKYYEAMNK